jgi:parallel beta-helix repeat protein
MRKAVALMLALVLLPASCITVFSPAKAQSLGSAYIKADGSVVGTDLIQSNGNKYTLVDNIFDGLVVEKDNIEIDGTGYALQGGGGGMGIYLNGRVNVTVQNTQISNFTTGIWVGSSSEITFSGNKITANSWAGIQEAASFNITISDNDITDNQYGVWLDSCFSNNISGNNVSNNGYGISLTYTESVGSSCNNSISNNSLSNNDYGIWLTTNSSSISTNTITETAICITLVSSFNNNLSGNNLSGNRESGNSYGPGFGLSSSSNNSISGNSITNTNNGVEFVFSNYNIVSGNNIADNNYGIGLTRSFNNTIYDNGITNNSWGVTLHSSSNNKFFHNSFGSNRYQVSIQSQPAVNDPDFSPSVNVFDDGYPSGGNYWSDYTGLDAHGDTIGDTPYVIDANNTDRYPLMSPYNSTSPAMRAASMINLSCFSSTAYTGFKATINGKLLFIDQTAISGAPVVLSSSADGGSSWQNLTLLYTGSDGSFSAQWMPPVSGNFLIKAEYSGSSHIREADQTINLAVTPYSTQNVFSVFSNSTVSELSFDSVGNQLRFKVTGLSGTEGYVDVGIAKSLVSDTANLQVFVDGTFTECHFTSVSDSWFLHFSYSHSTHNVAINLRPSAIPEVHSIACLFLMVAVISMAIVFKVTRKQHVD